MIVIYFVVFDRIYVVRLNRLHTDKYHKKMMKNKHREKITQPYAATRRRRSYEKTNEKLDLCGITTLLRKKMIERGIDK